MTIAFDAASALGSVVNTVGAIEFQHIPAGTPAGIIVIVVQDGNATDQVTGATYGGVAMTEVTLSPLLSTTGEIGAIYGYLLGSNVPTGEQTVSVISDASAQKSVWCISITAARDVEEVDTSVLSDTIAANPSVTLSLSGRTCYCILGLMSGQGSVANVAPLTNWTDRGELVFTSGVGALYSYDIIAGTDVTAGYTAASDDAIILGIAVSEVNEAPSVLTAAGVGAATFVGDDIQEVGDVQTGDLVAAGVADATFVSALHARAIVSLATAGIASATFVGADGSVTVGPFVQEIGVVPIRFVTGPANVVPVQIVGAPGIGIVGARETTDVANVVPVRESTEVGTTKIFLVEEP